MTKDIKKYTNEYGPLVSIIVPIYNAEIYLKDCLESIKNQTYKNIEVIMVDDGSKDGSAGIARRYASSDSRFIYILQENSGVSVARNTGLKKATGQYLCFADSDDILHCDMVRVHHEKVVESGLDIGVSTYKVFKDKSEIVDNKPCDLLAKTSIKSDKEALIAMLKDAKYSGYTWNKIFKTSLVKDSSGLKVGFEKKLHMCEDLYFCSVLMKKAGKVAFYDQDLYYYFDNVNGITSGKYSKKLFTQLEALEMIAALYKGDADVQKETARVMCQLTVSHYSRMIKAGVKDDYIENIYKDTIKKYSKGLDHPSVNKKDRILANMIMKMPASIYRLVYGIYSKRL